MGKGGDDSAENIEAQRRADEAARQGRIAAGIGDVNRTFARLLNPERAQPAQQYTVEKANMPFKGGALPMYVVKDASGNVVKQGTEADAYGFVNANSPAAQLDYENSTFLDKLQQSFLGFATPEVGRQAREATAKSTKQLARRGTLESSIGAKQDAEIERQRGEALSRIAARGEEIRADRAKAMEQSRTGIISQLEATGNNAEAARSALNAASNLSGSQEFSPLGELFNVALGTGSDVLRLQSQPGASPTIFSRGGKGSQKVIA